MPKTKAGKNKPLYKVMKEEGLHEGCIEQMQRLFVEKIPKEEVDGAGQFRVDDWEMREDVQKKVTEAWGKVSSENIKKMGDIDGYWEDFYHMFGFGYDNVDYTADVDIM